MVHRLLLPGNRARHTFRYSFHEVELKFLDIMCKNKEILNGVEKKIDQARTSKPKAGSGGNATNSLIPSCIPELEMKKPAIHKHQ